jgi:hypothetical protein
LCRNSAIIGAARASRELKEELAETNRSNASAWCWGGRSSCPTPCRTETTAGVWLVCAPFAAGHRPIAAAMALAIRWQSHESRIVHRKNIGGQHERI